MQPLPSIAVFAYGSNLCVTRMRARVPGAMPLGIGFIARRKFAYRKRGLDGSGKADAVFTGHEADRIWGAVYEIAAADKRLLDRHESLGIGYRELEHAVTIGAGVCRAWLYVALPAAIDTSLQPFGWYHDLVVHGAEEHHLPRDYISNLRKFRSECDPLEQRDKTHREIMRRCLQAPREVGSAHPSRRQSGRATTR